MSRARRHSGLPQTDDHSRVFCALLAGIGVVFVWSAISPHDRFTWFLEVLPVILALPLLVLSYGRFRFTLLVYVLMAIHAAILMAGGKYTYAMVPLGNWFKDSFGLARNHYDRLGHFAQGFVPALIVRELLLRTSPLRRGFWLFALTVSVCLAFSALYELFEWAVAAATGTDADAFLATQGDAWDTQKDMAMALVGAVTALLTLSHLHDRQLDRFQRKR